MKNVKNYKFYLKKVESLTAQEKKQMMRLMIANYPAFKKYYLKNKYYSAIKPQMENLIKDNDKLAGVGKFLWRKVKVGTTPVKLFAFGVLIAKTHQGQGLGTKLIAKNIKEAGKRGAGVLYGSTSNPIAEKILKKLNFEKLDVPVFYKHACSGKIEKENDSVWILEFKKGIIKSIGKMPEFYIGAGPL